MVVDSIVYEGKTINIHTYPRTINGVSYMYYRARINTGATTPQTIHGKTIQECKNQIYHALNIHTFIPGYNNLDITIGEAFPIWLQMRYGNGRPSTLTTFKHEMKHILNSLADFKVQKTNQADIQSFADSLSCEPNLLSPSTVHSIISLLRVFFQEYVDRNEIPFNPCDHVRLPVIVTVEVVPLTPNEIEILLYKLSKTGFRDLFALALLTGLRINEVRGLTWDKIDFEHKTILIDQQMLMNTTMLVHYIKNSNPRTRSFPQEVFDLLLETKHIQELQKSQAGSRWSNPDNLVFTTDNGNALTYSRLYRTFKSVVRSMEREKTRIHDLRHTILSYIWEETHDIDQVLEISNHKHRLSAKYYLHPTEKTQNEASEIVSKVARRLNITVSSS